MLIRPAALERAGGIAAIRQEIIDDCALARAVKRTGGKVWLGLTAETHSLRAYNTFAEIESMIARTAFNQLRHSAWLLLGTVLGILLVFVLPLVLLASRSALLVGIGGAAYLLLSAAYLPMTRFYRLSPFWALTLPFGAVFYMFATDSLGRYVLVGPWRRVEREGPGRRCDHDIQASPPTIHTQTRSHLASIVFAGLRKKKGTGRRTRAMRAG